MRWTNNMYHYLSMGRETAWEELYENGFFVDEDLISPDMMEKQDYKNYLVRLSSTDFNKQIFNHIRIRRYFADRD